MTEAPHDHRAAAGVTDPELAGLLEEHWEATMRRWPTWASRLGDRRHDDLLPGADPEDHEARRREERSFLERARQLDPEGLDEADRLTREVFLEKVGGELAEDGLRFEEWTVSPRGNPVTSLGWLPEIRPLETSGDVEPLLARYRAFPSTVDGAIACLRLGLADGRVGNADSVRRTLEMVEGELARSTEAWAAVARLELADEEMTGRARAEATAILEDSVRPAFARYAAFLRDELLPVARTGEGVGLVGLRAERRSTRPASAITPASRGRRSGFTRRAARSSAASRRSSGSSAGGRSGPRTSPRSSRGFATIRSSASAPRRRSRRRPRGPWRRRTEPFLAGSDACRRRAAS
jgi:uncharacterized protein (DUF885 family)